MLDKIHGDFLSLSAQCFVHQVGDSGNLINIVAVF